MPAPVEFRNIARYVRDVQANVPLYQAIGFTKVVREMDDMVVLQNEQGLKLVLHRWDERPTHWVDTAIGLTMTGPTEEARAYVEKAGFTLLRAPDHGDMGFFFIYGDLDGNPVNLVGTPGARRAEQAAKTPLVFPKK
ncbi:MAG: hypothetical protein LC624_05460 [Halobacteriales archaeon]|nr:hypothetical protein [Halobacteriales archaeon]